MSTTATLAQPSVSRYQPTVPANVWRHEHAPLGFYVSLFTGAGGDMTGALWAFLELFGWTPGDGRFRAAGVNHDPKVLRIHGLNHPEVEHWDCDIEKLDPDDVLRGHELTLLWDSAPCQDWSVAAGGPVKRPHKRSTPEFCRLWIRKGRPKVFIQENVREVQEKWPGWNDHVAAIRAMGYRVEIYEPDFADLGVPQNRKRMILIAVRDDQPIAIPKNTHSRRDPKTGEPTVPGTLPWRGAIECLDLSIPTPSMFARKRWSKGSKKTRRRIKWPYRPMTRNRVARYVREKGTFWEPVAKAVEKSNGPVPLLDLLAATPENQWPAWLQRDGDVLNLYANEIPANPGQPAGPGVLHVAEPGIFAQGEGGVVRSSRNPSPTAMAEGGGAMRVAAMRIMLPNNDSKGLWRRTRDPQVPVGTVTGSPSWCVADVSILPTRGLNGGPAANPARPATRPAPAAMAEQTPPRVMEIRLNVAEPALIPSHGEHDQQRPRIHPGNTPAPTVATCALPRVVCMYLVFTYNGKPNARSAWDPNTTVATVERHFVFEIRIEDLQVDVGLRGCTAREVARFQTFPDTYILDGTMEDIHRGLGNAVPPLAAYRYVKAALGRKGMVKARLHDFGGAAA